MSKKGIRTSGVWLLASVLMAFVGVISLSGAHRQDPPAPKPAAITVPADSQPAFPLARGEADTLDLQLD